ncbi:MAG: carbohydrate ABC transporter substrate-binding protein [Chloroflexi bacterium]|nr:carbohydrate ABC transporter substrate-binding protein [Chloroflexota bacterium]
MATTNQKNIEDPTFAYITNADLIHPGWKLLIPSAEAATAFLATYDPGKPELLFGKRAKGQLVVGSWWTAGGEAEGLAGMFRIYKQKYPDVEIVNATVAGGAGSVFKGVLKTRLIGGDPPDTFQLHAGLEVEGYSPEKYLQPLDDIYASEGLEKVFPKDLLTLLKYKDHYWGVPVNIHRSNVLWYNKSLFAQAGVTPPTTFDEFFAVCEALKAKGIQPFVIGTSGGWEAPHVFEDVLAGTLGAEKYRGLWTGATPWTDPGVTQALEYFKRMMSYANADHPALDWAAAAQYIVDGKGAMFIMGDWTNGYFTSKAFTDYGWAPPPGTKGIFVALSDSFALPAKAPNLENARNWLKVCGSLEGQEAFNPQKGSICARTDCNPALFNEYLQSAMKDWATDAIVPSVMHGAAAYESWVADFKDAIALFITTGDVASTQAALQAACVEAGICK